MTLTEEQAQAPRWIYCAVKDELEIPCAWPNCICGRGTDGEPAPPEERGNNPILRFFRTRRVKREQAKRERLGKAWVNPEDDKFNLKLARLHIQWATLKGGRLR